MSDFLARMAASSRERVQAARRRESEALLAARAAATPPPPALSLAGFDLIAELKLRSPAAGGLAAADFDIARQVRAYSQGGAAAVSVLTEPLEFKGELDHLRQAAAELAPLGCPVMRKDFLTDVYQLLEARACGASGVLLIVTMLEDGELAELVAAAAELGLFVLLETFDADDLERLARLRIPSGSAPVIAGVNCRDLKTLAVDFARFEALADRLPADRPTVAESGIRSADDVATVAGLGYRLALVGSALMRTGTGTATVAASVAALVAAGRAAVAEADRCS